MAVRTYSSPPNRARYRKYATGVTVTDAQKITVTGLTFTPRVVIIRFLKDSLYYQHVRSDIGTGTAFYLNQGETNHSITFTTPGVADKNDFTLSAGGFVVDVSQYNGSSCDWEAFT